jgi:hypothetical protein
MTTWSDAVAAAQKILGKDGKLPKPRVDPASTYTLLGKVWDPFDKARESLEKALLDVENAFSQSKNILKQYGDLVDGQNFGLKENDPKDKKRIADVTSIILKALQSLEDKCDENIDTLSKLDHLVADLQKVKNLKS